jgi:hypothetical protein
MVYAIEYADETGHENVAAATAETWGEQCDGFIAFSNKTDHQIDAVDLAHQAPEDEHKNSECTREV